METLQFFAVLAAVIAAVMLLVAQTLGRWVWNREYRETLHYQQYHAICKETIQSFVRLMEEGELKFSKKEFRRWKSHMRYYGLSFEEFGTTEAEMRTCVS